MDIKVASEQELRVLGKRLGGLLKGGECIELVGDVGAGKTTLTKAVALGMNIEDDIGSPSYTLSQTYEAPNGLKLVHYDFYRLNDPGLMADELKEVLADGKSVVVIEWATIVKNILPDDHLTIHLTPISEAARNVNLHGDGPTSIGLVEELT